MSSTRKGDIAEIKCAILFVEEGFEVYRNVNSDGCADLMIWDTENDIKTPIDVKLHSFQCSRTDKQEKLNVRLVKYNNEKNSYHFVKHGQFGWSEKKACKVNGKLYESTTKAAEGEEMARSSLQYKLKTGAKGYEYVK